MTKKYVVTCCFEILHDEIQNADIETCSATSCTCSCTTAMRPTSAFLGRPLMLAPGASSPSSLCNQAPISPVATAQRSVTSVAPFTRTSAMKLFNSGCAMRQVGVSMTSCELARRKPNFPSALTAMRTVVRVPSEATCPPTVMSASSIFAVRLSASRTICTFASMCCETSRCCHEQPPQPRSTFGHGGVTRWAEGSMMAATSPRAKSFLAWVICTSTNSPGSAPGTNTTRPSARCPSASPPATNRSKRTCSLFTASHSTSQMLGN